MTQDDPREIDTTPEALMNKHDRRAFLAAVAVSLVLIGFVASVATDRIVWFERAHVISLGTLLTLLFLNEHTQ